jgi:transposase
LGHANDAADEVRKVEFFRQGRGKRELIKGKKWLLLSRWKNLTGAMLNYLGRWIDQLKWPRLGPFEKLADMLLKHVEGVVNYCRTKVPFGVVEAVNGNIRMLINRGRSYKNLRYLLLKAKRIAVTNVEFLAVQRVKKVA